MMFDGSALLQLVTRSFGRYCFLQWLSIYLFSTFEVKMHHLYYIGITFNL